MRAGDVLTIALDRAVRVLKVTGFAERRGAAERRASLYEDLTPAGAAPPEPAAGERDAGAAGRPSGSAAPSTGCWRDDAIRPEGRCGGRDRLRWPVPCARQPRPECGMTYVVNDSCIKCKYMDCVEVCPVDCFYEGENMLVIHPDECIDCGVCEPECPVEAIKPDTEPGLEKWLELNAEYAKTWPNITVKKEPPADAKEWEGVPDKLTSTFRRSRAKATDDWRLQSRRVNQIYANLTRRNCAEIRHFAVP